MTGKHIMIIPDAHAHPDYSNERFSVLGDYINRHRPDIVVSIGDWADMASICVHSSKLSLEGKRYKPDCASAVEAQQLMFAQITDPSEMQWEMTLGNHDARIDMLAAQNPVLEGVVSMDDLQFETFGWNVHPFKKNVNLEGWNFQHYFPTGMSGRPISGLTAAKALVTKNHESSVQGHSHLVGWHTESTASGRRIHGVCVGCYSSSEQLEDWNANTEFAWWRGVVHIRGAKDGDGGVQFVPAELMEDNPVEHDSGRKFVDYSALIPNNVPDVSRTGKVLDPVRAGEASPVRGGRLSDADVRYIRKSTETTVSLGERFEMNPSTISKIRKLKRYAHVV